MATLSLHKQELTLNLDSQGTGRCSEREGRSPSSLLLFKTNENHSHRTL